jgi:hypothetical protein
VGWPSWCGALHHVLPISQGCVTQAWYLFEYSGCTA